MNRPHSLLFVCYANVCRSPLAEGIFRELAQARGIGEQFEVDSAGTCAMEGSPPHALSVAVAKANGITLGGVARQLRRDDLDRFDHILVMDRSNLRQIRRLANPGAFGGLEMYSAQIRLLASLPAKARSDTEVADPIGHGPDAYERLYAQLRPACEALLAELAPVP